MSLSTSVSAPRPTKFLTAAFLLIAIVSASAMARPVSSSKQPDLSGTWRLNQELSVYPAELLQEEVGNGLVVNSRWTPPANEPQFRSSARLRELMEATATIEIFRHGHKLTMNATGSSFVVLTRTVNTDGRPSEHSFGLGDKGVSHASWSDKRLILETNTLRGPKLTETYELSPDGERLTVMVKIEDPHFAQPLLVRRVYDKQPRNK
jgi:hypothetical protein